MTQCNISITLLPDGCGLELDGSTIYSIGNQNVDISFSDDCSNACGDSSNVRINGETPPTEVCDGDEVVVTFQSGCNCSAPSPTCDESVSLFVVSRMTNDKKIRLSLTKNAILKRMKIKRDMQKSKIKKLKMAFGDNYKKQKKNKIKEERESSEFWFEGDINSETTDFELSRILTMNVIHINDEIINSVDDKLHIKKINLNSLKIDEKYKEIEDELCENRFYLSKEYEKTNTPYIGLGSARWNEKYPYQIQLEKLPKLHYELHPRIVWAAQPTDRHWAEQSEYLHKGMMKYIKELADRKSMYIVAGRSFWSNNFICHKDVFYDFIEFWWDSYNYLYDKYKLDFDFETYENHNLKPAYLLERITVLYFSNRYDLVIKKIEEHKHEKM